MKSALALFCAPIVSALLLVAAFPPFDWLSMLWIGLVPFAFVIRARGHTLAVYAGVAGGSLTFYLVGLDWLRTSYGGTGLFTSSTLRLVLSAEVATACTMASFAMIRLVALRTPWPMAFLLPVYYVSSQYTTWWATKMISGAPFPWLQLGLPAIEYRYLSQVADLGGVPLVSLLIAAVNGAVADLAGLMYQRASGSANPRPGRALYPAVLVAGLIIAAHLYGATRLHNLTFRPGPHVGLMPTELRPSIDADTREITPAIEKHAPRGADILLWSERAFNHIIVDIPVQDIDEALLAMLPVDQILDGAEKRAWEDVARKTRATNFVGTSRLAVGADGETAFCNSLACIDPVRGYTGAYDKHFLVPVTEQNPFSRRFDIDHSLFTPGSAWPVFTCVCGADGNQFTCAAAICYDAAYATTFRLNRHAKPPDFFLISSAESFEPTGRLQASMLQAVRYRAIESRRAIVRNVAGGPSGTIDASGNYLNGDLPWDLTEPVLLSNVEVCSAFSLYSALGDWVPVCALAILCLPGASLLRRKPASRNPGSD